MKSQVLGALIESGAHYSPWPSSFWTPHYNGAKQSRRDGGSVLETLWVLELHLAKVTIATRHRHRRLLAGSEEFNAFSFSNEENEEEQRVNTIAGGRIHARLYLHGAGSVDGSGEFDFAGWVVFFEGVRMVELQLNGTRPGASNHLSGWTVLSPLFIYSLSISIARTPTLRML